MMEELCSGHQEELQRLRVALQEEHQARISSQEEQRTRLEGELEKSRAMVASLESDLSKIKANYKLSEFKVKRVLLNC